MSTFDFPEQSLSRILGLLKEYFYYLDIEEETDEGRKFHPNRLGGSCRAIDGQRMNEILIELKEYAAYSD